MTTSSSNEEQKFETGTQSDVRQFTYEMFGKIIDFQEQQWKQFYTTVEDIYDKLKKEKNKIAKLEKDTTQIGGKIAEIDGKSEKIVSDLDSKQTQILSFLGVYTAILTFLSGNYAIFNSEGIDLYEGIIYIFIIGLVHASITYMFLSVVFKKDDSFADIRNQLSIVLKGVFLLVRIILRITLIIAIILYAILHIL